MGIKIEGKETRILSISKLMHYKIRKGNNTEIPSLTSGKNLKERYSMENLSIWILNITLK